MLISALHLLCPAVWLGLKKKKLWRFTKVVKKQRKFQGVDSIENKNRRDEVFTLKVVCEPTGEMVQVDLGEQRSILEVEVGR